MLEELGKGHLWKVGSSTQEIDLRAEQLTKALLYCQSQRIGALVVLQRDTSLKDVWRTAVLLNADITEELLISIFWPGTPLHDGAVVIDQREIVAAGCYLPLLKNGHFPLVRHAPPRGARRHGDVRLDSDRRIGGARRD